MLADNLTMREHAAKKNRTGPETDACGTPGVTLSDIGVTQCYPGGVTCSTAAQPPSAHRVSHSQKG